MASHHNSLSLKPLWRAFDKIKQIPLIELDLSFSLRSINFSWPCVPFITNEHGQVMRVTCRVDQLTHLHALLSMIPQALSTFSRPLIHHGEQSRWK